MTDYNCCRGSVCLLIKVYLLITVANQYENVTIDWVFGISCKKSRIGQNPEREKIQNERKSRIEPTSKIEKVRINSVLTAGLKGLKNLNN